MSKVYFAKDKREGGVYVSLGMGYDDFEFGDIIVYKGLGYGFIKTKKESWVSIKIIKANKLSRKLYPNRTEVDGYLIKEIE